MKDVAAAAGVSWKTVSNVVNGTARVRPETRARVEAAIDALGYRPDAAGRQLRRGRSTTIVLAVPELTTPYFGSLAEAVIDAGRARGYTTSVHVTRGTAEGEVDVLARARGESAHGVILSPVGVSAQALRAAHDGRPLVLLGEHLYDTGLPHVAIDNAGAARELAHHLLVRGRRRFAFIGGRPGVEVSTTSLRCGGVRDAVLAWPGTQFPDDGHVPTPAYTREWGEEAANVLLNRGYVPDAVVCANDLLAVGVLKALRDAGLVVPGEVAVAGWDDSPEVAFASPPLTSVAPDMTALARLAVDLLVEGPGAVEFASTGSSADTRAGVAEAVAPHRIVIRESTAPWRDLTL